MYVRKSPLHSDVTITVEILEQLKRKRCGKQDLIRLLLSHITAIPVGQ